MSEFILDLFFLKITITTGNDDMEQLTTNQKEKIEDALCGAAVNGSSASEIALINASLVEAISELNTIKPCAPWQFPVGATRPFQSNP